MKPQNLLSDFELKKKLKSRFTAFIILGLFRTSQESVNFIYVTTLTYRSVNIIKMEMKFKMKEDGFNEIRKKMILRTIPIMLLASCGGLAISFFKTDGQPIDLSILPFLIPLIIGAMVFGLLKGMKSQKNIYNSYELTVDDQKIVRRQNLTPDIEIPFNEIKEIVKDKNGAITIKGLNLNNSIGIPPQVENILELELRLSKLFEITTNIKQSFLQKFSWVVLLVTVALMMTVYISKNKILVGLACVLLVLGSLYSFVITQKSKHIDQKNKKAMWLVLIVIFSVIGITYFKIFKS